MKRETISNAITEIDSKYIEKASEYTQKRRIKPFVKWGALAACLCGVLAAGIFFMQPKTDKATVTYGDRGVEYFVLESLLIHYTEEELFNQERLCVFRGTVKALNNITVDFGGEKHYRCVAVIEISKVYGGDISEGSVGKEITVLLPCPIKGDGLWVEDTDIISQIKVGMEGIFMPRLYNKDSYMEMNGKKFMKKEVAECGLGDGTRWVFLQTENGLIFDKHSYLGASGCQSLDDAEEYVIKNIK